MELNQAEDAVKMSNFMKGQGPPMSMPPAQPGQPPQAPAAPESPFIGGQQ